MPHDKDAKNIDILKSSPVSDNIMVLARKPNRSHRVLKISQNIRY
jgi:hypothetical protein